MGSVDISVFESFFSLPDVDFNSRDTRKVRITRDRSYAQIFLAQSTQLNGLFFMMTISDINKIGDVVVSLKELNDDFSFKDTDPLASINLDDALMITKSSLESQHEANWFRWNLILNLVEGKPYAVVFETQSTFNPYIYITQKYRKEIFPGVTATSSITAKDWSGSNFIEAPADRGTFRKGSLCMGFLDEDVSADNTVFDSGSIILNGNRYRRNYEVFLFVQNENESIDVDVRFNKSKINDTDLSEETIQTYMDWYFYNPGTLPLTKNQSNLKNSDNITVLESPNSFVLYSQPDKFPPLSKTFYPETALNLLSGELNSSVIHQSYILPENKIQDDPAVIFNNQDNMDSTSKNWAKFREKRSTILKSSDNSIIDPTLSVNPSFIDIVLNEDKEYELFIKTKLDSNLNKEKQIRGYTNTVKFKDCLISFAKYSTSSSSKEYLPKSSNSFNGVMTYGKTTKLDVISIKENIIEKKSLIIIGGSEAVGFDDGSTKDEIISFVGVHDIKKVTTSDGKELLYVIFQTIKGSAVPINDVPDISSLKAYFTLGVITEDSYLYDIDNSNIYCVALNTPGTVIGDGEFDNSEDSLDVDYQGVKFIPSPENDFLYFTARNYKNESFDSGFTKFGLWKINKNNYLSISSFATINEAMINTINTFTTSTIASVLNDRGFMPLSDIQEREIEGCYQDENIVYYGVCTEQYRGDDQESITYLGNLGNIHSLEVVNGSLEQRDIIIGEVSKNPVWMDGFVTGYRIGGIANGAKTPNVADGASGIHYDYSRANSSVPFIHKIGNILHIWMSPKPRYKYNQDKTLIFIDPINEKYCGTPFHMAVDLNSSKVMILRRFPFDSQKSATIDYDYSAYDDAVVSRSINVIVGGSVVDNKIHIVGYGRRGNVLTPDQKDANGAYDVDIPTIRWITYDKRIINKAVYYYDDNSHHTVDLTTFNPTVINRTTLTTAYGVKGGWIYDGIHSPFAQIEYVVEPDNENPALIAKYGVYWVRTYSEITMNDSSALKDYPAINVTKNRPRLNLYLDAVNLVNNTLNYHDFNSHYGEFNPKIINQNGMSYLITDNIISGGHVYKTYGLFNKPSNWGFSAETVSNSLVVTGLFYPDDNIIQCVFDYEFKNNATRFIVNQNEGILYFSGMKANGSSPTFIDGLSTDYYRYLYSINFGRKKPQEISFYYKLNYLREMIDKDILSSISSVKINDYVKDALKIPGNIKMTLRYATSWEGLYFADDNKLDIPLAGYFLNGSETDVMFYRHIFTSDIEGYFFRLESDVLPTPYDSNYEIPSLPLNPQDYIHGSGILGKHQPYAEILIKGLKFNDIDLCVEENNTLHSKKITINGIVSKRSLGINSDVKQHPSNILNGEVILSNENEILIDLPSQIYISELSFKIKNRLGLKNNPPIIKLEYLQGNSYKLFTEDIICNQDWNSIGTYSIFADRITGTTNTTNIVNGDTITAVFDSLNIFASTIRLRLVSNTDIIVSDFKLKTFASNFTYLNDVGQKTILTKPNGDPFIQYDTEKSVSNPELIIVNDIKSLIRGHVDGVSSYFATLNEENSAIIVDLGALEGEDNVVKENPLFPINRISFNAIGGLGRRIIIGVASETANNEWVWDYTVSNGGIVIPEYEYCIVDWAPQQTINSNKIEVKVIDKAKLDGSTTVFDSSVDPYYNYVGIDGFAGSINKKYFNSNTAVLDNYSTFFASNYLANHVFRPDINKDVSVPIVASKNASSANYDGILEFNCQMDSRGPIGEHVGRVGIIEKIVDINFPLKGVRAIKIMATGFMNNKFTPIRINGLKIYSPIIDNDGLPVWPTENPQWTFNINAVQRGG